MGWFFSKDAKKDGFGKHSAPALVIPFDTKEPYWAIRYLPDLVLEFVDKRTGEVTQDTLRFINPENKLPKIYFPPNYNWREFLDIPADQRPRLVITEGPVKAASLCSKGIPCIAIAGVFCFKSTAHGIALIPDFINLKLEDSHVVIVFDSDAATNAQVRKAEEDLYTQLTKVCAATVSVLRLPRLEGKKTGVDDYLVSEGVESLQQLIDGAEPGPSPDGFVVLGSKPIHELVTDAENALVAATDEKIFRSFLQLVRVVQYKQVSADNAVRRDPNANITIALDKAYLIDALSRTDKIRKKTPENKLVWTDPTRSLTELMISRAAKSPELTSWKRLTMLSTAPILLPNGDIVCEPGYHEPSGVWIDPKGLTFKDEHDRELSAKEARALIEKFIEPIYCLYKFEQNAKEPWNQTVSFAVLLSAILSIAARNLLPTVPMHGVDAPTAGSGKTEAAQAAGACATGIVPTGVDYPKAEEFDKHLPALLEKGDRVVMIDNVDMPMRSARLCAFITSAAGIDSRPLGKTETNLVENRAVILVTGNQLTIAGDLRRRTMVGRINTGKANPEASHFDFTPTERAKELFPQAVMAVLSVLRTHMLVGCPGLKLLKKKEALDTGSFADWNRLVRACLLWMGYADPVDSQASIRDNDSFFQTDTAMLEDLYRIFPERDFFVKDLVNKQAFAGTYMVNDKGMLDQNKFNYRFGKLRDTIHGELVLTRTGSAHGVTKWRVVKINSKEKNNGKH